jgi:GTP-binding protein Era
MLGTMSKNNFRSGFVGLVGRPNVGKSSLVNALIKQKVAIVSSKPETTRSVIMGIETQVDGQIIFLDTPGVHKPKTFLGKQLNAKTSDALFNADLLLFLTPLNEKIGAGDERIIKNLKDKIPVFCVLTKADLVNKGKVLNKIVEMNKLFDFREIFPISIYDQTQLDSLTKTILSYLPIGAQLYPSDMKTEETNEKLFAEIIRESALEDLDKELPHSLNVIVDEIETDDTSISIYAKLVVERESQKPIIIGKNGANISKIGKMARKKIKELTEKTVFLQNKVVVYKNWQNDAKTLDKMGLL